MDNGYMGQMPLMNLLNKATRSNKHIHMFKGGIQHTEIPPPLGWTFINYAAQETASTKAGRTVESKHYMSGADQPVLMHGIEFNALVAVCKNFGAAHQRYVVVVNDIKLFI